jgi:hypothetical protein
MKHRFAEQLGEWFDAIPATGAACSALLAKGWLGA